MRGRLLFSLCVIVAILFVSAGTLTLAQDGASRDDPRAERKAEMDALRNGLLEAAHESAVAEKKEKPETDAGRQALSRPGGLIVGFEGEAQLLLDLLARFAAVVDEYIPQVNMAVVTLADAGGVDEALAAIRELPGVKWAESDRISRSYLVPNDYFVSIDPQQWYLDPINAYEAWDITTGSSSVTLAVVDSGIRPTHEDLAGGRVLAGYNTFTGGAVTMDYDEDGHGTFVSGTAAADSNNTLGIAGIDWSCKIMPICIDNGSGIPVSKAAQGIIYAADHGAEILNLSYGGYDYSQAEREAVDYAREKGCVVVAARGNLGTTDPSYPACLHNVIGVGSSGPSGQKSSFSDYAYGLDVLAPGEAIVGPGKATDSTYLIGNGTSFSAPLTSGQAGLILADNPALSPAELEWRIEESAQGSGTWEQQKGFGIIDIEGSLGLSGAGYQDSMEPNDTRKQAFDLDTGIYQSYISSNSDFDVYRIRPDMSGYGSFGLKDIPAGCDYDLLLYQGDINDDPDNGTLVAYSINSGNNPEYIQYPFEAGETYFLAVDSYGGFSTQDAYSLLVLNPYISESWFFSEGYTGTGFDEYICMQNPGDAPAYVEVEYMFDVGQETRTYAVAPHSRNTINVNGQVGPGRNVSSALYSEQPVVAERPMYFNYNGIWQGGHDVMGATSPFYYWYFAEGYTGAGFDEYLCLQNPNNFAIEALVTYMYQGGGTDQIKYDLGPLSRFTISVNSAIGPNKNVSIMVESQDMLVAERPMYFNYRGMYRGGHDVVGVNVPSTMWFFAEGCTKPGFEEYLCLQNPFGEAATVEIYYLTSQEGVYGADLSIPALSRETVFVNDSLGNGYDTSVAVFSDVPIIAERPMYFNYGSGWDGGHDSQGCTLPSYSWYFAEGCTRTGFDTWLCLQNPGDVAATVSIDYMLMTGQTIRKNYPVAAFSRYTVYVANDVGAGQDVSIEVNSTQPIVAERPMYFSYLDSWPGGHDAVGYVPGQ
jgi:subtilisin family serine protease